MSIDCFSATEKVHANLSIVLKSVKSKCVDCRWETLVGLQKKEKLTYYDKVETVRAGN